MESAPSESAAGASAAVRRPATNREGRPPATHLIIRRATSPRSAAMEAAAAQLPLSAPLFYVPAPRCPRATRAPPPTFAKLRPRTAAASPGAPCARARTRASRTACASLISTTAPSSPLLRRGPPAPTPRPPRPGRPFPQLWLLFLGPVARGRQIELCAAHRAAPDRHPPAPFSVDPAPRQSRARAGVSVQAPLLELIELPVEAPGGPRLSRAARASPGARRGRRATAWFGLIVHRWAARLQLCGCQPIDGAATSHPRGPRGGFPGPPEGSLVWRSECGR